MLAVNLVKYFNRNTLQRYDMFLTLTYNFDELNKYKLTNTSFVLILFKPSVNKIIN